jgi:hypothetical protein
MQKLRARARPVAEPEHVARAWLGFEHRDDQRIQPVVRQPQIGHTAAQVHACRGTKCEHREDRPSYRASARISAATHAGSVPAAISTHGPGGNAITAAVVIDFDGTADTGRVSRVTSIRAPSTPLWRACSRRRRRHQVSVVGARPCSVQNARTLWPLASCRASHCACSAALTLPRARDPLVARIGGALAIIVSMSHRSRHQLAATTLYSVGHLLSFDGGGSQPDARQRGRHTRGVAGDARAVAGVCPRRVRVGGRCYAARPAWLGLRKVERG